MNTQELINEIRSKVDIVDFISSYIPLIQKGKNYFGVCPFHNDNNPSMSVSREKQIYKCFSCGASGNVFNFLMDYEHIEFKEALKILAKHFNSLKYELCTGLHINCRGETEEDIFCNTIIYVVHEKGISKKSETELLSHFKRRFNMMSFQTVQDNAAIHKHLTDNYHDVRNALYSKQ